MDLGSESSTPASTLAPLPAMPIDSAGSLLLRSPRRDTAPPPALTVRLAEVVKSDSAAEAPPSPSNALSAIAAQAPPLSGQPSAGAVAHARPSAEEPAAENAAGQVNLALFSGVAYA